MGKGVVHGYESHYAVVSDEGNWGMIPIKPSDSDGNQQDALVVFNSAQVLPRHLVYFSKTSFTECTTVLWVSGDFKAEHAVDFATRLDAMRSVNLVKFGTVKEILHWLALLSRSEEKGSSKLLVISDRMRKRDGEEIAGERLCQYLKADASPWKHVPFLLFWPKSDPKKVTMRTDPSRAIHKAREVSVAVEFVLGKMPPKKWKKA